MCVKADAQQSKTTYADGLFERGTHGGDGCCGLVSYVAAVCAAGHDCALTLCHCFPNNREAAVKGEGWPRPVIGKNKEPHSTWVRASCFFGISYGDGGPTCRVEALSVLLSAYLLPHYCQVCVER